MHLSLCLDPGRTWADLRRIAQAADEQQWHAIYVSDHFMPHVPEGSPADGPVLESWTVLSALAVLTTSVRIGPLVLGNTYRHPAVVAKMAATLHQVSAGRVVLGLGAGWQPNEHAAYGIGLPPVAERLDRFEEACAVITSLLSAPRTTIEGHFYRVVDAPNRPAPDRPLPILIGGAGERRTLRIAARYADIWHTWATPEEFARLSSVLDRHCADLAIDPSTIDRATGQVVRVTRSPAAGGDDEDLTGSVDQVAAALHEYAERGVSEFVVRDHRDHPLATALETMEALSADVLPRLD